MFNESRTRFHGTVAKAGGEGRVGDREIRGPVGKVPVEAWHDGIEL